MLVCVNLRLQAVTTGHRQSRITVTHWNKDPWSMCCDKLCLPVSLSAGRQSLVKRQLWSFHSLGTCVCMSMIHISLMRAACAHTPSTSAFKSQ